MKKFFSTIVLAVCYVWIIFYSSPMEVKAHILQTDGSIGAVLHISPDDDPVAGQRADFFFEIKDRQGKFTPEKCECIGRVFMEGKEIYTQQFFQENDSRLENAIFSFVFPKRNIYKIQMSGNPITANDFEPFVLEWDVRVDRTTSITKNTDKDNALLMWVKGHMPHVIGFFVILGGFLYVMTKDRKGGGKKYEE